MKSTEYFKIADDIDIGKKFIKSSSYKGNPHYHNAYEIHYFLSGSMNFFIHENEYKIKKGDLVFIDTFEIHNAIYNGVDYEKIIIIYKPSFIESSPNFSVPNVLSILNEKFSGIRLISLPENLQQKIEPILLEMTEIFKKQNQYTLTYLRSYLLLFSTYISEHLDSVEKSSNNNILSNSKIRSIISFLNDNLEKELSLDKISKHFNLNKYYLCRFFKEHTGLSITNYINRKRILTAEKLINSNNYSITDISLMAGFNNLTHFERTFKQITGVAPRNYKKSNINPIMEHE